MQNSLFTRHFFATPAVRHLAWLVHGEPLLSLDDGHCVIPPWPLDIDARLLDLDRHPGPLLEHLAQRGSRRLGLYFEQLYGYALETLLGQRILAQNLPIRLAGRTLGELDFLAHDPFSDRIIHHEIAVKFYMGWNSAAAGDKPPGWYGPDNRDQLSAKLKRLREHQIPMWRSELGLECLRARGLAEPQVSHLGLYGYLFGHQDRANPPLPEGVAEPRPDAGWRTVIEPDHPTGPEAVQSIVRKPDWLGPVQLPASYQPGSRQGAEILNEAASRPVLLATLQRTGRGFWLETKRQFVTPENWCRKHTGL